MQAEEDESLLYAVIKLAEQPFAQVWDNEEDADYDSVSTECLK